MEMLEQREALAEAKQAPRPDARRPDGRRGIEARVGRGGARRSERLRARASAAQLVAKVGELRFYRRFLDEVSAIEDELAA